MPPRRKPTLREERTPVFLEIRYRNAGHLLMSYCTNLSRGGMFVRSEEPLAPGSTIVVKLSVPGHAEELELRSEVRWSRNHSDGNGPAGMGLQFEDVDGVLGAAIDSIVVRVQPMAIVLVGAQDLGSRHLAALIETLVNCEVQHVKLRPNIAPQIQEADLVIVDLEAAPEPALQLLEQLQSNSPPTLALCNRDRQSLHEQASRHTRVLPTPIESLELEEAILQTLAQVTASHLGEEA